MGFDYPMTESISAGSRMLFNFIPGDALGETFYYSWEVASLRYRF
jgi:hypothetical protein